MPYDKDDKGMFLIRRDFSGGMNNRQHGTIIGDNQATVLLNTDIGVPGETTKRPGITSIEDLGINPGYGLFGFEPVGGTSKLIAVHGQKLEAWTGSGAFNELKTNFILGTDCTLFKAGEESEDDVLMIKINGNNWFRMLQNNTFQDLGSSYTGASDPPPNSNVALWFRQRMWVLKDNLLYYSSVFPADFSTAFGTTSSYKVDVGTERALVSIRDQGIIAFGDDAIYGINPSTTPAATDKVEKILDIGCVSRKSVVQVADDIMFLAPDGVRGLFRSQQDKLQAGTSYPLSFSIKDEVDSISWGYVNKACAMYYDNKYFLSIAVDGSTYNNEVWVYYPASQAWMVIQGWNVGAWAKMKVGGEERLYAINSNNGKAYRAWYGYSDDTVAINYQEEGRKEDFGAPLVTKVGGVVKVRAESSGVYTLYVYASTDDQEYTLLGTMDLSGGAPTLPVALPFDLASTNLVEEQFHLDSLGEWRDIRLKIVHNDLNGSDDIKIFERSITPYVNEYQDE